MDKYQIGDYVWAAIPEYWVMPASYICPLCRGRGTFTNPLTGNEDVCHFILNGKRGRYICEDGLFELMDSKPEDIPVKCKIVVTTKDEMGRDGYTLFYGSYYTVPADKVYETEVECEAAIQKQFDEWIGHEDD